MPPSSAEVTLGDWLTTLPDPPGIRPLDRVITSPGSPRRAAYRRRRPPTEVLCLPPDQQIVSLVRAGGALRWRLGVTAGPASRRAGARAALPGGEVVKQYAFERLESSQVYSALVGLDKMLTPSAAYAGGSASGLRRLTNGRLGPAVPADAAGKRVLLFIHGTFSCSEALLDEGFGRIDAGKKLLTDAEKHYDRVLAFDHPTLSVSPALNAFDLAALLRPSPASLDVICHSRGGLVARWFCEAFAPEGIERRVVFVGAPLAGTSLAAAPRLRSSLDFLANIADVLRSGAELAAANAFFLAAAGLLRVVGTVTSLAAKTPALDAAIALIPGLDGQSRVGNNEELRRLRANTGTANFASKTLRYSAICADFEPREIGWNFLRLFSKPLQRLGDLGADIVFPDRNDLVVDTLSMVEVADFLKVKIAHDFGTGDRVHHLNYFRQPETVAAIRGAFKIPTA
jgi:hypothetical protein